MTNVLRFPSHILLSCFTHLFHIVMKLHQQSFAHLFLKLFEQDNRREQKWSDLRFSMCGLILISAKLQYFETCVSYSVLALKRQEVL
jgi:hypothetical protein